MRGIIFSDHQVTYGIKPALLLQDEKGQNDQSIQYLMKNFMNNITFLVKNFQTAYMPCGSASSFTVELYKDEQMVLSLSKYQSLNPAMDEVLELEMLNEEEKRWVEAGLKSVFCHSCARKHFPAPAGWHDARKYSGTPAR